MASDPKGPVSGRFSNLFQVLGLEQQSLSVFQQAFQKMRIFAEFHRNFRRPAGKMLLSENTIFNRIFAVDRYIFHVGKMAEKETGNQLVDLRSIHQIVDFFLKSEQCPHQPFVIQQRIGQQY